MLALVNGLSNFFYPANIALCCCTCDRFYMPRPKTSLTRKKKGGHRSAAEKQQVQAEIDAGTEGLRL